MTERLDPLASPAEVALQGTGLIEAGAGTGKTWTLVELVLRLLLERQLEIGRILVVTYTRAASGELRGRIRARLAGALAALEHDGSDPPAQARLRLAIESFDEAAIFTIHGFCQRALGETAFAAAHAFERELIADQGELLAAVARDAWRREMAEASVPWAQWLIDQVKGPDGLAAAVRPFLGRVDARLAAPPQPDRLATEGDFAVAAGRARAIWQAESSAVRALLDGPHMKQNSYSPKQLRTRFLALDAYWASPDAALLPLPEGAPYFGTEKIAAGTKKGAIVPVHPFFDAIDNLLAAAQRLQTVFDQDTRRLLHDFLCSARKELAERKRRADQQTYDDLLGDLAGALAGPAGPRLVESLRARYHVALVDEFQDTDPLQLDIFTRVFGTPERPLIYVGDPKQAIYGFRGADVFAYLQARAQADASYALLDNRRSDPKLLAAVNALFARPLPFLLDGMPYARARPAMMERQELRIEDTAAPLTLWTLPPPASDGFTKEAAGAGAATAVANDIARLLGLAAEGRATLDKRPLGGGDIAVLVRRHSEGEAVRQALARHGIPSVSGGGGSLWHSDEATEVERLLLAVAEPAREGRVRAALATVLFGAEAAQLAAWRGDDASWSARLECFHDDWRLLRERGFMAMWRRLLRREEVVARVLARPDGERRLTNYRHLAELLQAAEQGAALDATGLARHIARQREAPEGEDHLLRLESDARLVRIVTLHAAKGLQYPVVYCPFLWSGPKEGRPSGSMRPVLAHLDGRACLDFGSDEHAALLARAEREAAAEELRLAYVALTRAEHRCVVVWAKANASARSPLAWLLFGPREDTPDDPRAELARWLETHDEMPALRALESALEGALRVALPPPDDSISVPVADAPPTCRPRVFSGRIPAPWRVQSFSSLAARLAEEAETADRDGVIVPGAVLPAPSFSSIHGFPRGTRAGSCLHALFERVEFQDSRTAGRVAAAVLTDFGYAPEWRPVLERLVVDVLATPLNEAGLRLADVPRGERLVELEFAFPLGSAAERAGYMKGFIDLVFRHAGRWYIVDWKSNWLGSAADDYGQQQLAAVMCEHRYDLQQRIYVAALKRALALREPDLDWEGGFGGVFYLFLRGIAPGSTNGIHFHRPTLDEIAEFLL